MQLKSRKWAGMAVVLALAVAAALVIRGFDAERRVDRGAAPAVVEAGFVALFNGRDLDGWEGERTHWSVRDGAITGQITADAPLQHNTFLVWQGEMPEDFELRLKFRIESKEGDGANSGVQYRSRMVDFERWIVGGYQADMDSAGKYLGMLYEEQGRGILQAPLKKALKADAGVWRDYTIIAQGRRLQHWVDGVQIADFTDNDPIYAEREGLLALQLHAGAPMTVQFKQLRLKSLVPAPTQSPPSTPAGDASAAKATPAQSLQLAPGFRAELVHAVPTDTQGSWVALTVDPQGRLIAADQYGALYRIIPGPIGAVDRTTVERLQTPLSGAQGLLYAFDSLYVMVNESPQLTPGIWRLRDTDGDGRFEQAQLLRQVYGRGEHGVHALVASPDGRWIYFAAGNHTALPQAPTRARPVAWGEDHLLPRLWDPKGHAVDVRAPGGYVARMDPEGKTVEVLSIGMRNHYDIAFDGNGEWFTFDSDMEWDQGLPWYVPTRIQHLVDGADYGWRSGAGRWPDYYADSLPAILDVGPGSPTGLVAGTGARFPATYQRALFACDWTYGTLYAIHLTPDSASFRARREEFVAGKPLPLTDVVVNPHDGALYFIVGGRGTQSALYRVSYVGKEATAPVAVAPPTPSARLRRSLEALQAPGVGPAAIDIAWPHLDSSDRYLRYAARVAIERQPPALWAPRALRESRPRAASEALIALARVGDKALQPPLLQALARIDLQRQPAALQLPLLRAWQLAFTRMGRPASAVTARLAAGLEPLFPHADLRVNRELAALLVYLDSPTVVAKAVPLLDASRQATAGAGAEALASKALLARNEDYGDQVQVTLSSRPDRQQIALAYALRQAKTGWTPPLRRRYFEWYARSADWNGGNSFRGFLAAMRKDALANTVSDAGERATLAQFSAPVAPTPAAAVPAIAGQGAGRSYTVAEAAGVIEGKLTARNFARGKALYTAATCSVCHRFNGEGGGVGPDLTQVGHRFSARDILESIIEPDKVVSDQYPNVMPPRLINHLSEEELQDLMAYLLSAGDAQGAAFKPVQ